LWAGDAGEECQDLVVGEWVEGGGFVVLLD
jgi:hypothetical protein